MSDGVHPFPHRHLTGIHGLQPHEILFLLDEAEQWVKLNRATAKHDERLFGLTQINAFFENSTRTLLSFEIAGKRLGADVVNVSSSGSSVSKGETLLDTAKTIFSGLIVVDPDAQKTDAYQSNRNLMLSDEAEAHSLPGLEIQANDVRCTHGATSARVDREQEFYLEARGIKPAQARELLVFGFFEEVLGKIENEQLHDALTAIIREKFNH